MRSFIRFSVLLLSVCALASCGGSKDDQWSTYTSADGGFSVSMPGKVDKSEKIEMTAFGKQKVHFITWKPSALSIGKFKLFQVAYTDCPQRVWSDTVMLDFMLDSAIRMKKRDFSDKDFESENIDLNGYPGRSFIFLAKDDITIVKQCITNGHKYDLTVIAKSGQGTNPEISQFFNSFQALK